MRVHLFLAALLLGPGLAAGQVSEGPDNFGTSDLAITMIGFADFSSENGTSQSYYIDHLRWDVGGGWLIAPLNVLPNGARLTQVVFYFRDESPAENLQFWFCQGRLDSSSGDYLGFGCNNNAPPSAGEPGDSYSALALDVTIQYRYDPSGNGDFWLRQYYLRVETPAGDSTTAIRAVRLLWHRQVSPAPQTASFNDVPTGDSAFRFIEALVASGITVGCGAGNYCPDAPLTRRQMAVFLAKALGLHWPWDAQ
jgi:S-layer homology domain